MAHIYADENVDYPVVVELRSFGHDVLTAGDQLIRVIRPPKP